MFSVSKGLGNARRSYRYHVWRSKSQRTGSFGFVARCRFPVLPQLRAGFPLAFLFQKKELACFEPPPDVCATLSGNVMTVVLSILVTIPSLHSRTLWDFFASESDILKPKRLLHSSQTGGEARREAKRGWQPMVGVTLRLSGVAVGLFPRPMYSTHLPV